MPSARARLWTRAASPMFCGRGREHRAQARVGDVRSAGTRRRRRRARARRRPCASRARSDWRSRPGRDTSPAAAASRRRETRRAGWEPRTASGGRTCRSSSCRTPTRRSRPSASTPAVDVDDAGRPEVAPHELFVARVDELDRPAGGLREPRRLDGLLARVLAAVAGAHVGHDDAHAIFGQAKRLRRLRRGRRTAAACRVQTVTLPSVHSATAARGSSGTCAMYGMLVARVEHVRRRSRARPRRRREPSAPRRARRRRPPAPSLQSDRRSCRMSAAPGAALHVDVDVGGRALDARARSARRRR